VKDQVPHLQVAAKVLDLRQKAANKVASAATDIADSTKIAIAAATEAAAEIAVNVATVTGAMAAVAVENSDIRTIISSAESAAIVNTAAKVVIAASSPMTWDPAMK